LLIFELAEFHDLGHRKVVYDGEALADFFVDMYLDAQPKRPREIILDLDATDDLIHGTQEGRFFHGYYGNYCYLPLYIFAGDFGMGGHDDLLG